MRSGALPTIRPRSPPQSPAATRRTSLHPLFGAVSYGLEGVALDVRAALGDKFLSQFFTSGNQQFSYNGKQYAVGLDGQSFGIFYSSALLEKANVAPPDNWDEMIKAVPALKAAGLIPLTLVGNPSYALADFLGAPRYAGH